MTEASTHLGLPAPRGVGSIALARLAAVLVCVIGEIVLALWLDIIPGLEQALPGLAGMTPNVVLGVIVAGLGLLCFTFRRLRLLARLVGLVLIAGGLVVLGQGTLGIDLGLDQNLLPADPVPLEAASQSADMTPGVTGALILFGVALLFAKRGRVLSGFSQIVTLVMLAQVLIVLAG